MSKNTDAARIARNREANKFRNERRRSGQDIGPIPEPQLRIFDAEELAAELAAIEEWKREAKERARGRVT